MGAGAYLRALAVGLLLAGPAAAQLAVPAELPPDDYAGQQYVDSKGCLFMRAGPKDAETWIPRVTREGVPLCGNPPSGQRVPAVDASPDAPAASP